LLRYAGDGIARYPDAGDDDNLSADQRALLDVVSTQTARARRGVFLWNIESYEDVETPRDDFPSPVTTLYSVAAGFKPNRILHTHGFTENTKVVYFDYSQRALDIKRCMLQQWDGVDFPHFVQYLFKTFPYPETFYQLWNNVTPNDVNWDDVELAWQREVDRWGGVHSFSEHWQAYRELEHEFICGDVLSNASLLVSRIRDEPGAIIWWSNAFFTMYGNWFYGLRERQQAYERWIEQLVKRNPRLYLLGSDFININVNSVQAAEYWAQYCRSEADALRPCRLHRTEIRM
jgi:hypothetical protein